MSKELTELEITTLNNVLHIIENQFDESLEATANVFDHDDEYVDFEVHFEDETYEQMKICRADLSSNKTDKEIAEEVS